MSEPETVKFISIAASQSDGEYGRDYSLYALDEDGQIWECRFVGEDSTWRSNPIKPPLKEPVEEVKGPKTYGGVRPYYIPGSPVEGD